MCDEIDYGYEDEQQFDNSAAWNHQMDLEVQRQEEDWQSILTNDPGYHSWMDEINAQNLAARIEDDHYNDLAAIENERSFNVLTAWD